MTKVHIESSRLGFNVVVELNVVMGLPSRRRPQGHGDGGTASGTAARREPSVLVSLVLAHDFVVRALAVFFLLAYALTYG